MGLYTANEPAGWIASIIGAVVLLFVFALARGGRSRY
jgi:hypothetical protein